ncbi:glycosyl hydrolase family 43 protein [Sodiomyces alkalinus F11]|uniref:Glycosyl hydrolase family 43 protein n=1 Tax=Sodiomyces alkalinus (strain CBS 110278 / VKM F-3762 / F11) TaxID=1314773 RepID=A0A3N2PXY2_SODAK|nr:glycosyl hydrolase family 43 protein [Sodiomyces alkalinus F11]ROT39205.1 glycosyl hydrolase family 43 protein [Sodiomyces alkalinus F11]
MTAQLALNFPDPSILQDSNGIWYAFATNGNGKHVQAAWARDPLGPWMYYDRDVLPDTGWATGRETWAPDVRRAVDGEYVLYFAGEVPGQQGRHCIGVATSRPERGILGPYTPQMQPWVCPLDQGGAIDASGFVDPATGRRYVVYKIEGYSDWACNGNNSRPGPEGGWASTPIMLQEVGADGYSKIGQATTILDRVEADGPLVEAPNLVRTNDGVYVLFYSSNCFNSRRYNVNYATSSRDVRGPYVRAEGPLLQTGSFGLVSPGGGTSVAGGPEVLVFHAYCPQGRCLHATRYSSGGSRMRILG